MVVGALEPLREDQLRLGERAEELGVEYLVAEAGVERLDPGFLPGRARLEEAPVPEMRHQSRRAWAVGPPAPAGYPTLPAPTLIE